jgi:hypothetical protein
MSIKPVIVAIAKFEQDYIEEWVKYHLALGFDFIYLYDNEDIPTYNKILTKYANKMKIIHCPGNNFKKPIQYKILDDFNNNYMHKDNITHVIHIDIDEFICLKIHSNIKSFINEYFIDDCAGIGIQWKIFGDSNNIKKSKEPVTQRFTMCQQMGDIHIKTLFSVADINPKIPFKTVHNVNTVNNKHIKTTNGLILSNIYNLLPDTSIIQLNHYKCKTFEEFKYTRTRGRADLNKIRLYILSLSIKNKRELFDTKYIFDQYNYNEVEDLTAKKFYQKLSF